MSRQISRPEPLLASLRISPQGDSLMRPKAHPGRIFALWAIAAPIGILAVYIAYLVVPDVIQVVVPAVVHSVVG
jgi:hypothetical protein